MNYHCRSCGTSKRTAKAMDAHIIRCAKRMARKDKKDAKKRQKGK